MRRAELLKVEQPMMALEVLHDVLTSRRHRTWSPVHEQIMFKYIDLCIQLQAYVPASTLPDPPAHSTPPPSFRQVFVALLASTAR